MKTQQPINIVSVLPLEMSNQITQLLSGEQQFQCTHVPCDKLYAEQIMDVKFWSALPVETADVVLISLSAAAIVTLTRHFAQMNSTSPVRSRFLSDSVTLVGVLHDCQASEVTRANRLDLDGLIATPLEKVTLMQGIDWARKKSEQRIKMTARQEKVRQLCRNLNQKRRHLREKVDLVCRDLVFSNLHLTKALQEMHLVCDFQNSLAGEFDMQYMLHKALKLIQTQITESSTAFYLAASEEFEAHLTGLWYDRPDDIEEMEKLFRDTLVRNVLTTQRYCLVPDAAQWDEISLKNRKLLAGLSLLSIPVRVEDELVGVVISYKQAAEPLTEQDLHTIQLFLHPLGRAVQSTYLLKNHMGLS